MFKVELNNIVWIFELNCFLVCMCMCFLVGVGGIINDVINIKIKSLFFNGLCVKMDCVVFESFGLELMENFFLLFIDYCNGIKNSF